MKVVKRLNHNEFWSSVAKLSIGQVLAQVISLVATLVLSRLYTDSDYGIYGIIVSTANIIISIISLALGSAVMVAETDRDSRRVFTVAYFTQIFLLIIVVIVMIALMPVKRFLDTTLPYPITLLLMALYIATNILYSMTRVYINRLKMNNVLFLNSLINAGCTVFISIPMGILGFGFLGLLFATLLAQVIAIIQMINRAMPFVKIGSFSEIKKTFKECKEFILFQYPSNFMGTFSQNMPNQTLYNTFGDAALGSYAMCNKLFQMPLNLVVAPVQTIYFRTAAAMKDKTEELAEFTYKFLNKLMSIAVIPMVVLMSFGEKIFSLLLGPRWSEAGLLAAIMCPYFYFFFCNGCITYLRVSIGKQKVNLYMTIIQFVSAFVALIISKFVSGDVIVTVAIFATINAFFNMMDIYASFVCLKRNALKYLITSTVFITICMAVAIMLRVIV